MNRTKGKNTTPVSIPKTTQAPYSSTSSNDRLQDFLDRAEDLSGIEFDSFDNFKFESLPENKIAQTRQKTYNGTYTTILAADPELKTMDKDVRTHALIHEGIHGLQFNGQLYDKLLEENLDRDEVRKLHSLMSEDQARLEGVTEIVTHFLHPNSQKVGRRFYPDEMKIVESELEQGNEIIEDINNLKQSIISKYKEVYEVEFNNGVYREKGTFDGEEYEVLVEEEPIQKYGEDLVNKYLAQNYVENEYQESIEEDMYKELGPIKDPTYSAENQGTGV